MPMDAADLSAWLRLTLTPGVGNQSARRLLAAFGWPGAVFEQSCATLQTVVSTAQARALLTAPPELPALLAATQQWLAGGSAALRRDIIALGDERYPPALLHIEDPPLLLYLLGKTAELPVAAERAVAIVGSRNPTPQGAANARQFARILAQSGLSVVSGMALGIDGAAHEGALDALAAGATAAAVTLAVVGTGLDRVYPKQHRDLAHRIAQNGILVSEYPLGMPPLAPNFPKRNRLIAALSQGTLVVEAALQSGSLITARLAAEQGRDVFAIPGSIHATQSRGCHALIRQGAKLVESAQDVLEELPLPTLADAIKIIPTPQQMQAEAAHLPENLVGQDPVTQALLQALGHDLASLDVLLARTGLETAQLQARLLELELDGHIARLPGGLFQRLSRA